MNSVYYTITNSPYGPVTIISDGTAVTGLHLKNDRYFTEVPTGWIEKKTLPVLVQAMAELAEYFENKRTHFSVPLKFSGTSFQEAIWKALIAIPYGSKSTYADIAAYVGKPRAVRAVGTAIGRNQICIFVPCHRVVPRSGGLGDYVSGASVKQSLLALEKAI